MARASSRSGRKRGLAAKAAERSGGNKSGRAAAKRASRPSAPRAAPKRKVVVGTKPRGKAPRQRPIELYFWPTPNGWKISIMLEECRLPYTLVPVNIAAGEQFRPDFLAISPNNRMPAIVDPDGPGRRPISVFESGAILQYLARKTGRFYPRDERGRVEVDQWLFWQMGGLGPMCGQVQHFRQYAPETVPYAIDRYTNEVNRLYGVMNTRLADRPFLAGKYSIADMACVGWIKPSKRQGQSLDDFRHLKRWFETVMARPAVRRGIGLRVEAASRVDIHDPAVRAVLFTQRAR